MLNLIQVVNVFAFAFMAYVFAGVLRQSLKDSELLKPITMSICSVTISYHLFQSGVWIYVIAAFVGYFLHTCVAGYTRKGKAPDKRRKKSAQINP